MASDTKLMSTPQPRPRPRRVRLRPTGQRVIEIKLPATVWERAQSLIRAARDQSMATEESSRRMLELVRPYCPPGFRFNERTDEIVLVREPRAQVMNARGA